MLPQKIQALFEFIDFLDVHKKEYIEKYIPLCNEVVILDTKRFALNPRKNYVEKQQYDKLHREIGEKCEPVYVNVRNPILNKLKELEIWGGDDACASIWNWNMPAIFNFKESFEAEDIPQVISYKHKYLSFRTETNNNFLSLQIIFSNLDEILKDLFDFFKDNDQNEFESFETKTVKVNEFGDAIKGYAKNKGENLRFALREESLLEYYNVNLFPQVKQFPTINIKNEITMGDNIHVGSVTNQSGQVIIGKDIHIADSFNEKNETAEKIAGLITLIRQEENISDEQKQSLITNFEKVKAEVLEKKPDKAKIYQWLSATKGAMEKLVFTYHVSEAAHWVFNNLHFF